MARGVPYGAALCVVNVVDCVHSREYSAIDKKAGWPRLLTQEERDLGDYSKNRWIFVTEFVKKLDPIPVIGRQGIFTLPDAVEAAIRSQLNGKP